MEITSKNRRKIAMGDALTVYAALFGFGMVYDLVVGYLEERGLDDGYSSDLVAVGTAVTLLGALPLIGLRKTALTVGAFVASGVPMAIGSKLRHRKRRMRETGAGNGKYSREWTRIRDSGSGAGAGNQSEETTGRGGTSANGRVTGVEQYR